MFDDLTYKLEGVFKKLRGRGKLTEKNITDALKEVRRAFLEADVNYKVAKDFIAAVKEKALGEKVLHSITPGQQIVKIIHDELVRILGPETSTLSISSSSPPTVVMLVGLQGSGKTTMCGKLSLHFRKLNKSPVLVAADIYRPAAVEQLKVLGKSIKMPVFHVDKDPVAIAKESIKFARDGNHDIVIIDTAGRLHIDDKLMTELEQMKAATAPEELLLIADAMTGQDAVNIASEFNSRLDLSGVILTKMDGDARGGAALSIRTVTDTPIKMIGIGEKLSDLEVFHPERLASRILGMGDMLTLVEKAQEAVDMREAEKFHKKLQKEAFTFDDFYSQLQQLRKMGSLESILSMVPGIGNAVKNIDVDDHALVRIEAMIQSMTPDERQRPNIIDGSRRRRIALGSGNELTDVNRILKQFGQMQKMIKKISRGQMSDLAKGLFKM
jgi:signal recognition particle subunit SRP54